MPKRKLNIKPLAMKYKAIKEFEKGLSNKHAFLKYGVLKNTFLIISFFVDLFLKGAKVLQLMKW